MKYYRLKFTSFPVGLYLKSYKFAREIPFVESCEDPDEALVLRDAYVETFLAMSHLTDRVELEELGNNDPYYLY